MKPYLFSVVIDKLTNSIEHAKSGINHATEVLPVTAADLKTINKKSGWRFNWKTEAKNKDGRFVYKLIIAKQPDTIQCLLSCRKGEGFFYMHLIETAPHNLGKAKLYNGAPANMVAFVCRLSMEAGFEGLVSFTPKTRLINHYYLTLGAIMINKTDMAIFPESAKKLVHSYYP